MSYNPSLFTATNKPLGVGQGVPTDARSYYYDSDTFTNRVFASKAEVLAYMSDLNMRKGHVSYFYYETGIVKEGWWKEGTDDNQFVEKGTSNAISGGGSAGQVAFWTGAAAQSGNNSLWWDDTNKRLGVGTNAPLSTLNVLSTTEQLRLSYNATDFMNLTVSAGGAVTLNTSGGTFTIASPLVTNIIQTNSVNTNSNLWVQAPGATSTTIAQYFLGSATTTFLRIGMRGSVAAAPTTGAAYGSFVIGTEVVNIAATGTHPIFAQLALKALSITTGAGALTNAAILYLENSTTQAVNNYSIWSASTMASRLDGSMAIGVTMPTAKLHIGAGTATAGTSSLKLGAGVLMKIAEYGAVEYANSHLWFTIGSNRIQLDGQFTGNQTITLTGDVTGSGTTSIATTIGAGKITYAMVQNIAALSVFGRAGNTTGVGADITSSADFQVLRRTGTTIAFGALNANHLNSTFANGNILKTDAAGNISWVAPTVTVAITSLNGLTDQVQTFVVGVAGTDFNIISASGVHTYNLPLASATVTGKLSMTDWSTFNNKQSQLNGAGFVKASGTTISYDNSTYLTANQSITLSGDITGSGTTTIATSIGANKVTSAMFRQSLGLSVIGKSTSGTGNVGDITASVANTFLNYDGTNLNFAKVPVIGIAATGTPNSSSFLRGDGTWSATISGLTTLNGLTAAVQTFAIGVNGTDFVISSAGSAHTFNLPVASATVTGKLAATDWVIFNGKQPQLNGTGFVKIVGTTISYDNSTYITANQTINLTGDITGSGNTSIATTIGVGKVTNAMLRQSSGLSIIGKATTGAGVVADISASVANTFLGYNGTVLSFVAIPVQGIDATGVLDGTTYLRGDGTWSSIVAAASINTLNTLTAPVQTFAIGTAGTDFGISSATTIHTFNLPIASSVNTGKLSKDDWIAFNSKQTQLNGIGFVKMSGVTVTYDNSVYLTANQTITLTGDVTGSGSVSISTTIGNNRVSNLMIRQSSGLSILGRSASTTGNIADITATLSNTFLNYDGTSINFAKVPIIGINATGTPSASTYLRGDGTWIATPAPPAAISTLNGLTDNSQTFVVGGVGTDFNISSSLGIHTFNLPIASAVNTGKISSTDWSTFNAKQSQLNGTGFVKIAGTVISYDNSTYLTGNQTVTLTGDITGSGATLIATSIGTAKVTSAMLRNSVAYSVIGRSSSTTGVPADIAAGTDYFVLRRTGTTLAFGILAAQHLAASPVNGYFLKTDGTGVLSWAAVPIGTVTGNGVANQVSYWDSTSNQTGSANFTWDNTNSRLTISAPKDQFRITDGSGNYLYFSVDSTDNKAYIYGLGLVNDLLIKDTLRIIGGSVAVGNSTSAVNAYFNIPSGNNSVAPMIITTGGSLLTTVVNGAIETDADHIYYTIKGVRYQLDQQAGTTGVKSLNGLTVATQTFTEGTAGTDFDIVSAGSVHTFNLPIASATNTGKLSASNWSTFNNKQAQLNGTGFVKVIGTTVSYDNSTYLTANQSIALTGDITGSGTTSIATSIGSRKVTEDMFRASLSLSVVGRSGSTSGSVEDIRPTVVNTFLGYTGTTLNFSLIPIAGINATGTPSATNYLRGDGTWSVPPVGTGTVTSVGLSLPNIFTITGSPIVASGTLTGTLASQSVNTVFAGPTSGSAAPTFRLLVAADIPVLDMAKITTGNLSWSRISSVPSTIAYTDSANTFTALQTVSTSYLQLTGASTAASSIVINQTLANASNIFSIQNVGTLNPTSGTVNQTHRGFFNAQKIGNSATGYIYEGYFTNVALNADYTTDLSYFMGFRVGSPGVSAGNNGITAFEGYRVDPVATFKKDGITNTTVYGFRGMIASGTNRWNMCFDGTADNYMCGDFSLGFATLTIPSAKLHIAAGTATAGTAPLKLTTGTALTATEAGAIEFHSGHLWFTVTNGGARFQLDQQSTADTNFAITDLTLNAWRTHACPFTLEFWDGTDANKYARFFNAGNVLTIAGSFSVSSGTTISLGGANVAITTSASDKLSFFKAAGSGVVRQSKQVTSNNSTAGATYTANEKDMLQAIFNSLINYGLIA